jgi:hypothetical protein
MKIRVVSGKHRIFLPIPYFWMDNPISLMIVRKTLQNDEFQIDVDAVMKLMKEFSKMDKSYKGLELVRVENSDGQFTDCALT